MNLDDLRIYLLTKSAITTLIQARISMGSINPLASMPAVRIEQISTQTEDSLSDSSTPQVGFTRVQIDSYGSNYPEARAVADAIRKAPLQQYRGMMGTTAVKSCFLIDENSFAEAPKAGEQVHRHVITQDYRIEHRLPQPTF